MRFIKVFAAALLAQVVLIVFLFGGLVVIGMAAQAGRAPAVEEGSWLVIDVYGDIPPYHPPESISSEILGGDEETLHRILSNLEKAAADERIAGVLLKVSAHNSLGSASVEEIRGAIGRVRDADKPVYAWSDDLDRRSLFLASACDSIFMAPPGYVLLVGMGYVREFYKGSLDKLDIHPNLHKIKDYKTAAESVTRKDMSPEAREMAGWMLEEFWDIQVGTIAASRGLSREALEGHMEHAVFRPDEARRAGLVDGVLFWDELVDRLEGEDEEKLRTVSQDDYAEVSRASVGLKGDRRIAVVHAWGLIGGRSSRTHPAAGVFMGHETVVGNLRRAAENDRVDAIVFRVDSNGGESLTSEIIAREVARIRGEKPIVVSMVDVAASGGYTISYKATKIVADPLTVTGSIGSIAGKFVLRGFFEKLGFTYDWVTKGPNSLFFSPMTDFTDEQWDRFVDNHNQEFDRWLEDIAQERGISVEELTKLAHGRVWTGRQAVENGLVDELGGLERAIEVAKEEAGIPADEQVTVAHYPKKRGLYALVTGRGGPLGTARWLAYRLVREEVTETVRLLTRANMRLWTGAVVD